MEAGASCGVTDQPCIYAGHELENCRYCSRFQNIFWDLNSPYRDKLREMLRD